MATFPALKPSGRTFTPGGYPNTPFKAWAGNEGRVRHSNVMLESTLRLIFTGINETQMLSILTHYQGQRGGFESFALPSDVWSGVTTIGDYSPTGYRWCYTEPPSVTDLPCGNHIVELSLATVPPEGVSLNGLSSLVALLISGGNATASNGLSKTISWSFAPGLGDAPVNVDGLTATVTASIAGGGVEIIPAGITATVTASIQGGGVTVSNGLDLTLQASIAGGAASIILPTVIGTFVNSDSTADTSLVLTRPTYAAGDLLLAVLMWRGNKGTLTAPSGWSLHGTYMSNILIGGVQQNLLIYTKTADSSEPSSYTWSATTSTRNCGLMAVVRNGSIQSVTENYGNGATASINTVANRLNLTVFTWIYANTSGTESYSQSASSGTLTQITDSPRSQARISGAYIQGAVTITSTHDSTSTADNPNHGGICIAIA